jgi:sulfite exporter TauE/SafE
MTTGALFSDTTVFSTVGDAGTRGYQNVRTMSYAVGGMAMVALGVMSMFGKLRFSVLFMAIAGLAMIALIDQAFLYFGGSDIAAAYSTPSAAPATP